jgi:hypothetical protein
MGLGDLVSKLLPLSIWKMPTSRIAAGFAKMGAGKLTILQSLDLAGRWSAELAASLPRVVIVGEGGAGKSTLLKQMLGHAATAGYVPVWVPLSSLPADGPLTIAILLNTIVEQAQNELGLAEVNRAFFEALIADGRLAIGFDALDECGSFSRRQRVRKLLVDVAREWKRCRIFATSRPDALRDTPLPMTKPPDPSTNESTALKPADDAASSEEFVGLTPRPFTTKDVGPFLSAAFEDGERLARDLLRRTGVEALIETPLTLMLVGLVAQTRRGLPGSRTLLFTACLETVIEEWESAKASQPAADGLKPAQRKKVLQLLGWEAQLAGGDTLDAWPARASLARLPYIADLDSAKPVVDGLARRNLLLRAEVADDGSFEVQRIRFSHPQFREFLAGAHLAEQFALDPVAAAQAMAPHWFETSWLDVLRFAVTSLEREASRRNQLLQAALAAGDPYRDLLHRPDFLAARLLAALPAAPPADNAFVEHVIATLERAALDEPALRVAAMDALLAMSPYEPALPAIERFARGDGLGDAFGLSQGSFDASLQALRWRLRAIEALAVARGAGAVLPLLPENPPGLSGVLETAELRARLDDRAGAYAIWQQLFQSGFGTDAAASMEKSGEGDRFDGWLSAALETEHATVRNAQLARTRGLITDDAPVWERLFAEAATRLATLDAHAEFVPLEISEAVYAVFETKAHASSPAGRALVIAALHHPSLVWYVGPRVGKAMPDLAAKAVQRLVAYVLEALAAMSRMHDSRANVAVTAICDEPDDGLAVPALLTLLQAKGLDHYRAQRVVESLQRRGHAGDVLNVLRPRLELPPDVDDRHPDEGAARRGEDWQLARLADPAGMEQLLDGMYRNSDPETDARRLMQVWHVSGVAAVARDWFAAVAQDVTDDRGRRFLHTLTTHERDTGFTDEARHALGGSVFDDPFSETFVPWTGADAERAFVWALERGWFADERDNEEQATPANLVWLISLIADGSGQAAALRHADALVRLRLQALESADKADAAAEDSVETLADVLRQLSNRGLHDPGWMTPVAEAARKLSPATRAELVTWLNANA